MNSGRVSTMLSGWRKFAMVAVTLLVAGCFAASAHAAERITLTNGFSIVCDHSVSTGTDLGSSGATAAGAKVRVYMDPGSSNFIELDPAQIASTEEIDLPAAQPAQPKQAAPQKAEEHLTPADLRQLLARAGARHNLDADLLASVVREESGGHPHAVSRAGAQGLMQLMPGTAAQLGVSDAFAPGENIGGGTEYLDSLLHRYHDNLALALAAYNAGPAAVDRWHGIPPYRETRLYVARVIHEFNRRIAARRTHNLAQVAAAVR